MICGSYMCEGGHFAMFPAAVATIFGSNKAGLIFPVMINAVTASSLTSFVLIQYFELSLIIWIAFVISIINLFLILIFNDKKMKGKSV